MSAAGTTQTTAPVPPHQPTRPPKALPRNQLLLGDALTQLRLLPSASVDMALTSPPYFQLRDYGVAGQLGQEAHIEDWVDNLAAVAGELARVLVPTGSLWLNLSDSYSLHPRQGAKRKSLLLGPERLALRLVGSGWTLRNKIVWQKSNPMPTSVRDRLAATWEALYVFTRSSQAFFDLDAIRVPHKSTPTTPPRTPRSPVTKRLPGRPNDLSWRGANSGSDSGLAALEARGIVGHPLGKNPGDVWTTAGSRAAGGHHATFPVPLVRRAILAGCPEARCTRCRLPYRRAVIRGLGGTAIRGVLRPSCTHVAAAAAGQPDIREPGIVLDPFFGAGTAGLVAEALKRDWLGIELSPVFGAAAVQRLADARRQPPGRAPPPS